MKDRQKTVKYYLPATSLAGDNDSAELSEAVAGIRGTHDRLRKPNKSNGLTSWGAKGQGSGAWLYAGLSLLIVQGTFIMN